MERDTPEAPTSSGFVELGQFEIDERSVRLLRREYCLDVDSDRVPPLPVGGRAMGEGDR